MKNILITIAAFLLIWFYIQPFAKDIDTIVDDMVYTQEEKASDSLYKALKLEEKRIEDSIMLDIQESDSILLLLLDSAQQNQLAPILKSLE